MGKQTRVRHSGTRQRALALGDQHPPRLPAQQSMAHLVGSRGVLSEAPQSAAPPNGTSAEAAAAQASKLANARARQQRKKQRRFERRREEWAAGAAEREARAAQEQQQQEENAAAERQARRAAKNASRPPLPTKAERRKAIKKAKKAAARGEPPPSPASRADAAVGEKRDGSAVAGGASAGRWPAKRQKPAADDAQPPPGRNGERALALGVRVTETVQGSGPVVRDRLKVKVAYVGRLGTLSGPVFDKGTITFRIGRGEVIKGWDIGCQGCARTLKALMQSSAPPALVESP